MISELKFKRIEEQIEEIKDSLENGIENPDRILGDAVQTMELMFKTLVKIKKDPEIAKLLGL